MGDAIEVAFVLAKLLVGGMYGVALSITVQLEREEARDAERLPRAWWRWLGMR